MFLYNLAGNGRVGAPYAAIEHAYIVVDFCRCAHGRARVAGVDLLLYGYGRWQAANEVALGLAQLAHKLAGIGRQALHISAPALGIECVEGKRRLARARQAGDDHKLITGYGHVDVLEVVDARTLDYYI